MRRRSGRSIPGAIRAQRGIVMWVALVVLIIMSIAGLAMLRQMGGGISIAGNLAFKETATSTADAGTEAARAWYIGQTTAVLQADAPAQGYYATWGATVDPVQIFATLNSVPIALDAGVGNVSSYVIQRLCANLGAVDVAGQTCSDVEDTSLQSHAGNTGYNPQAPSSMQLRPYYRVTTRVAGPRNTVSYIQVILN